MPHGAVFLLVRLLVHWCISIKNNPGWNRQVIYKILQEKRQNEPLREVPYYRKKILVYEKWKINFLVFVIDSIGNRL